MRISQDRQKTDIGQRRWPYLVATFSIPLGIQHFTVAARYFEEGYLRRLKKRTETFFAMAAHDCFNSE